MTDAFLNQEAAKEYVESVGVQTERLLLEGALNVMIGFLIKNESYIDSVAAGRPLDLLVTVQALHAFFRTPELVQELMSGNHDSLQSATDKLGIW